MSFRELLVVASSFVLVLAGTSVDAAPSAQAQERMSETASNAAANGASNKVDVIVQFQKGAKAQANAAAESAGGAVTKEFDHLPMVVISVPAHALEKMSNSNGVKFVSLDSEVIGLSEAARVTANVPPRAPISGYWNGGKIIARIHRCSSPAGRRQSMRRCEKSKSPSL